MLSLQGGKLFGKNKDGGPASSVLPLNDLQTALENERKRSNKLQEQMDRLRAENLKQANECEFIVLFENQMFFCISS